MSYNDELSEMVRNFAKLHSERDSALQELALANSELKRLQAENEELKAKFNNNSLCNRIQIYEADEARMRKALEEIREIAKIAFIVCDDECGNANKFAEIQDKINEVLK